MPTSHKVTTEREGAILSQRKFLQDAPPSIPTLTSSKYHITWTRLADLPVAIYAAYVAVQDRKIYISGGKSPVEDARDQVFMYELDNNEWGQLPTPDHRFAVSCIINGKLTLIGGFLIATDKRTNKVSTFDQTTQSWISYYPDLLSDRSLPGVVTHMEYVIAAGGIRDGNDDDTPVVLDDIEILNWEENLQWKRVSIHLPVPMYALQFTVSNDHLFVVGYNGADWYPDNHAYKLPVALITNPAKQLQYVSTKWIELAQTTHRVSSLASSSSPLIVLGGCNTSGATTADIQMYDTSTEKWKKIDSLSFARSRTAVAAINNDTVIIVGGCTKDGSISDRQESSLTVIELGQIEKSNYVQ